jgi:RNA-directed DNA polymerase
VALQLEARTESIFHPDSYGYRPGKSAHDALAKCRQRCWEGNWVVDLDIEKFFDSLDHDLVVKAVEANTDQKWVLLYVKRWLKAPLQMPDGNMRERDRGTPQGSAVSPVLANLFLHYAMDSWLEREFPAVGFERYADLCRGRHKSAYADDRVMPTVTVGSLVRVVSGCLVSA